MARGNHALSVAWTGMPAPVRRAVMPVQLGLSAGWDTLKTSLNPAAGVVLRERPKEFADGGIATRRSLRIEGRIHSIMAQAERDG